MFKIRLDFGRLKLSLLAVLIMYFVFWILAIIVNFCVGLYFYESYKGLKGIQFPSLTIVVLQSLFFIIMSIYMLIYRVATILFGIHLLSVVGACVSLIMNFLLHLVIAYLFPMRIAIGLNALIFSLWLYFGFIALAKL
jgi:hypothetical protein